MQIRSSVVKYHLTDLIDGNWPFTLPRGISKIYPSGDRLGQPSHQLYSRTTACLEHPKMAPLQLPTHRIHEVKLAISDCGMNTLTLPKTLDKVFDTLVGILSLRAERSCCSSTLDMLCRSCDIRCMTLGLKSASSGSKFLELRQGFLDLNFPEASAPIFPPDLSGLYLE